MKHIKDFNSEKVMYLWTAKKNFGDALNLNITELLANGLCEFSDQPEECNYYGIGSYLEYLFCQIETKHIDKELTILGGGIKHGTNKFPKYEKLNIIGLRGHLTKQLFIESGYKVSKKIFLGDLGLLAPLLINKKELNYLLDNKKYELGIIPHFNDANNEYVLKINQAIDNSIIINVDENPIEIIKKIASCKKIISSSLHGLILADALGVPNMWFINNDKEIEPEPNIKYLDYYSIYDIQNITPIELKTIKKSDIDLIDKNYQLNFNQVKNKQLELKKAFENHFKRGLINKIKSVFNR